MDFDVCREDIFTRSGIKQEDVKFLKEHERVYSVHKQHPEVHQIEGYLGRLKNMSGFERVQQPDHMFCMGYCFKPKYAIFSNGAKPADNISECGVYIKDFLSQYMGTYKDMCLWEARICVISFILAVMYWFRIPALTKNFEIDNNNKDKIKTQRLYRRIYEWNIRKCVKLRQEGDTIAGGFSDKICVDMAKSQKINDDEDSENPTVQQVITQGQGDE